MATKLSYLDLRLFEAIDLIVYRLQFLIIGRTEIFSTRLIGDFLQQLFIDLHLHILILYAERSRHWIRSDTDRADADRVDPDAERLCYACSRQLIDRATVVHSVGE